MNAQTVTVQQTHATGSRAKHTKEALKDDVLAVAKEVAAKREALQILHQKLEHDTELQQFMQS